MICNIIGEKTGQVQSSHNFEFPKEEGLTYGRAVTWISQDVRNLVQEYDTYVENCMKYFVIAACVLAVAGLVMLAISGITANAALLAIAGVFTFTSYWGMVGIGALAAVGIYASGHFFARSAEETSENFSKISNSNSTLVNSQDIAKALSVCGINTKGILLGMMNFQQLSIARQVLGAEEFEELISTRRSPYINLWKSILTFSSSDPDLREKLEMLKDLIKEDFAFAEELRKQLKDVMSTDDAIRALLNPSPYADNPAVSATGETITFTSQDGTSIVADKGVLSARCDYFENLLSDFTELNESGETEIKECTEDYMLHLKTLTEDTLELNKENVLRLLPIADAHGDDRLLNVLGQYVTLYFTEFNDSEIQQLMKVDYARLILNKFSLDVDSR